MPKVNLQHKTEVETYTTFIRDSNFGQITQTIHWHEVKENWVPYYIYLEEDNTIVAAASVLVGDGPHGKRFAYCCKGPVMDLTDSALFNALVQECLKYLPDDVYLLKFDPEIPYEEVKNQQLLDAGYYTYNRNIQHLGMHGTIQPRMNMVIDFDTFDQYPTSVYDIVPSKIKNKLKKAKKEGIQVFFGTDTDTLAAFYTTYESMSLRHNIRYRPKEYFERMLAVFQDTACMRIYLAKRGNEILASGLAFLCGKKVWYMYAGSVSKKVYHAPYAIQEAMIQWAIDSGCHYYDMGGIEVADETDSLYTFKRNFVRQPVSEYIGEIDYVLLPEVYQQVCAEKYGLSINLFPNKCVYP